MNLIQYNYDILKLKYNFIIIGRLKEEKRIKISHLIW